MNTAYNTKQTNPVNDSLLGACDLSDEILAEAFKILFDRSWKRGWSNRDKADEMRSILKGGNQYCRPFSNFAECFTFLSQSLAK